MSTYLYVYLLVAMACLTTLKIYEWFIFGTTTDWYLWLLDGFISLFWPFSIVIFAIMIAYEKIRERTGNDEFPFLT